MITMNSIYEIDETDDEPDKYSILWGEIKRMGNKQIEFQKHIDRIATVQAILIFLVIADLIITGILIYLMI